MGGRTTVRFRSSNNLSRLGRSDVSDARPAPRKVVDDMDVIRSRPDNVVSPLRFALLCELYFPSVGGQEVFFQELGETLVQRGHSVDVYCIGHKRGLPPNEVINGVSINRNPSDGRYLQPLVPALKRNWLEIVQYSAGVRNMAQAKRHDFYLLNQWPLMHVMALPAKVRERSGIHWCEIRDDRLMREAQSRLPRMVRANFSVSHGVGEGIAEQSGRQCVVLPSGIQLERYRSAPKAERSGVLCVGRLAPHKNLPLLIDAFALATEQGLSGDLTIAGDGPSRVEVEAYAAASPVASRIHVLGSVTEEQKIDLLSRAVVLGLPSMREGFPRVISEAMASGAAVVTADFPGNGGTELVAHYGAGIVCGTEPTDFAKALLAAAEGWDTFSAAGLAAAPTLDWSWIADALEARVREIIGSDGAK